MSLLDLRGVHVVYPGRSGRDVSAVAGVDLTVAAGQIVALVGESGCGKSSLGRVAVGLEAASQGEVLFDRRPLVPIGRRARPVADRRLQMVFQDSAASLNPRRRVGELIADGGRLAPGTDDAALAMSPSEALERVGLPAAAAARFPHEFSGGQRQRIAIARALAARPRLVVADEPISALDASAQASIARLLVELVEETGMGLLFISHDLSIVRAVAHVTAVMYLGRIVETGPSVRGLGRPNPSLHAGPHRRDPPPRRRRPSAGGVAGRCARPGPPAFRLPLSPPLSARAPALRGGRAPPRGAVPRPRCRMRRRACVPVIKHEASARCRRIRHADPICSPCLEGSVVVYLSCIQPRLRS